MWYDNTLKPGETFTAATVERVLKLSHDQYKNMLESDGIRELLSDIAIGKQGKYVLHRKPGTRTLPRRRK